MFLEALAGLPQPGCLVLSDGCRFHVRSAYKGIQCHDEQAGVDLVFRIVALLNALSAQSNRPQPPPSLRDGDGVRIICRNQGSSAYGVIPRSSQPWSHSLRAAAAKRPAPGKMTARGPARFRPTAVAQSVHLTEPDWLSAVPVGGTPDGDLVRAARVRDHCDAR